MNTLSAFERDRYTRQLMLPEFGETGQHLLKASSVLISRAGGVGGTTAACLARAGIGKLILVHPGNVEAEYLNRWPLAFTEDHQQNSSQTFASHIKRINPAVEIIVHDASMQESAMQKLVEDANIIVDAAPIFEERYAMNDAAIKYRKPLVSGAMYGMEAYATFISPGKTACLRCIYPEPPNYWVDRSVFPVLGSTSSLVGNLLANEAIKYLTHFGSLFENKLWFCDLQINYFTQFELERDVHCKYCREFYD